MPRSDFAHIRHWIFDLDNTLYPPEADLFSQIEPRMTAYVMQALGVDRERADQLRLAYWRDYGNTLCGLMDLHGVDPGPYLTDVHDIDMAHLEPAPNLARAIAALPGQKIIHTNGCAPYAERVLAARGLSGLFDEVYGVEHADFRPKPEAQAYKAIIARAGIAPASAAMFEDVARNLAVPHDLGMTTVLVHATAEGDHVHHQTDDLAGFVSQIAP